MQAISENGDLYVTKRGAYIRIFRATNAHNYLTNSFLTSFFFNTFFAYKYFQVFFAYKSFQVFLLVFFYAYAKFLFDHGAGRTK